MDIQEHIALAPFTTLKIGGPARYFVKARSEEEVLEALEFAQSRSLDVFILGGGSNLLVSDAGFDGLVLQIALRGITSDGQEGGIVNVTAASGDDWDTIVSYAVERDLAGIECLSGIPGFVGGTPVQNVGAYGQEVSETITAVRCLDRETHEIVDLSNGDCGFSYRTSIFNSISRNRYIVLSVAYALRVRGEPRVIYKDLTEYFRGSSPSLAEVRDAVLTIRRRKSMVIDPADPNSLSAGSFFKNPVIERSHLDLLRGQFADIPNFDFGERVKIPAAWLIEKAGFHKGFSLGKAGISSKHTLALINRGSATAAEIIELKNQIQHAVHSKFGIELQPEPIFVGFEN